MIKDLPSVLTLVAAVGSGLVAGIFYAFSTFVMKALARLPAEQGIAAMQSINVAVINAWFLTAFFGTAVACVYLTAFSLMNWSNPESVYLLGGCLLYLVGTMLVTIMFNIPWNNALADTDPKSTNGAEVWASYLRSWTVWNHFRTTSALVAAVLLTLALCQ